MLDLGARHARVGQTDDESWYVWANPEGNAVCLLRRKVPLVEAHGHAPLFVRKLSRLKSA